MKRFLAILLFAAVILPVLTQADEPPTYDISYIRHHAGELEGQRVRVENRVCFVESARYGNALTMLQDPEGGPWSCAPVYDRDQRLIAERGNTVTVVGIVSIYYSEVEINISDETEFPPEITGNGTIPDPIDVTCAEACQEMYISCLIRFTDVEVISDPDQYGNVTISDGSGTYIILLKISDPPVAIGTRFDWIIGHNDFHMDECKIRPRDDADWGDAHTPTPTPTPTLTPTPTPDECTVLGCEVELPAASFLPGDEFYCDILVCNPTETSFQNVPLFSVLDAYGNFYFLPLLIIDAEPGITVVNLIPSFIWPDNAGEGSGIIYSAMTDEFISEISGELGFCAFSWSE